MTQPNKGNIPFKEDKRRRIPVSVPLSQKEGVTDAFKLCSFLVLCQAFTAVVLQKFGDNKDLLEGRRGGGDVQDFKDCVS